MSSIEEPIIAAKDLTISYELHRERKKLTALQDINLDVKAGEFVVLVLSLIHISEPTRRS